MFYFNQAYLDDVTDDELSNLNLLCQASGPDDVEGLLALDSVLKSSKLFLFGPVVEGRHEDNDDDGDEDGDTLDPTVVLLLHNTDCKRKIKNNEIKKYPCIIKN